MATAMCLEYFKVACEVEIFKMWYFIVFDGKTITLKDVLFAEINLRE